MNYEITGDDFKWDEHGFEDEKVVACSDTKCFVDITASKTDEGGGYREVSDHFSHS